MDAHERYSLRRSASCADVRPAAAAEFGTSKRRIRFLQSFFSLSATDQNIVENKIDELIRAQGECLSFAQPALR